MSKNVSPVSGAARYTHGAHGSKWVVLMADTEGALSAIQNCASFDAAVKAADKWQKKENAAVTNAAK
jgi:hypothetical protein